MKDKAKYTFQRQTLYVTLGQSVTGKEILSLIKLSPCSRTPSWGSSSGMSVDAQAGGDRVWGDIVGVTDELLLSRFANIDSCVFAQSSGVRVL